MAEVLITLTIIGVIAALTIPNLMVKYEKKQTVTKLKEVYSILTQALNMAQQEDPNFTITNYYTTLDSKIRPHLKNYIDCNEAMGKVQNNTCYVANTIGRRQFIILPNNVHLQYHNKGYCENNGAEIIVDINGFNKPNQFGRDKFSFCYSTDTTVSRVKIGQIGLFPNFDYINNYPSVPRETIKEKGCNTTFKEWCAKLIINDNWEIKDDYPW